jgi:branched-chain amino acid transport system ATP-binding protein
MSMATPSLTPVSSAASAANVDAEPKSMPTPAAMAHAVELRGVRKSFGKTEIIRGVNLAVVKGERHAVIGPNGAGKSTLFNLISGRFLLTSGNILLNGDDLSGLKPFEINRKGLSRSFQITNIFANLSVFENIRCAVLYPLGYKYSFWKALSTLKDANQRADEMLEQIGLKKRRDVKAGLLTYAEQRALEIGITIAGGAEVILLDEPTAGMSRSESDQAVVEHDMSVVFGLADRISVLVYGEVIATDAPQKIRGNAAVQEAYLGTPLSDGQTDAAAGRGH